MSRVILHNAVSLRCLPFAVALLLSLVRIDVASARQPIAASQAPALQACEEAWGMRLRGWRAGADCTVAQGLTCDPSGMISAIDLSMSNLTGPIPPDLTTLTALTRL
ncbi:unnamed protein product [Closterium sp. NIES-53]